jgi:hypothetical protein
MDKNTLSIVKRLEISKQPIDKKVQALQKKKDDFCAKIDTDIANCITQLENIDSAIEVLTRGMTVSNQVPTPEVEEIHPTQSVSEEVGQAPMEIDPFVR